MKLSDLTFLTDESLQPAVVDKIKSMGFDVLDVKEQDLRGSLDSALLRLAFEESRIVITHDSDFGKLAFRDGFPLKGIIYLRPGHYDANITITSWEALVSADLDLICPFILVVENLGEYVKMRYRRI